MTHDEINTAIVRACPDLMYATPLGTPMCRESNEPIDPLNSPEVQYEIMKTLDANQIEVYRNELIKICDPEGLNPAYAITAHPYERAEAFLRAKGRWK